MSYSTALGWIEDAGFVVRNGVAKPTNYTTLGHFKSLQANTNRLGALHGVRPISVDGDLGAGTLSALAAIRAAMPVSGIPTFSGITALAHVADTLGVTLGRLADSAGAPTSGQLSSVTPPPSKPVTIVNPTTGQEQVAPPAYQGNANPPAAFGAIHDLGPTGKIIAGAGLAVAVFFLHKEMKKGGRRRSRR